MYKFLNAEARKLKGGYISQPLTLDRRNIFNKAKGSLVINQVIFDSNGDIHSPRWITRIISNPTEEG